MVIKMSYFRFFVRSSIKNSMLYAACLKTVVLIFTVFSGHAFAIDNPDAPDLIAAFEVKEKSFIAALENPNNGYRENLVAYTDYQEFLDKELNVVYKTLQAKLPKDNQQQLKQAQLNWLKYRDLEFTLIENTWTKEAFGSSSSITRGQYKATIVRTRVIQLMHYAKAI